MEIGPNEKAQQSVSKVPVVNHRQPGTAFGTERSRSALAAATAQSAPHPPFAMCVAIGSVGWIADVRQSRDEPASSRRFRTWPRVRPSRAPDPPPLIRRRRLWVQIALDAQAAMYRLRCHECRGANLLRGTVAPARTTPHLGKWIWRCAPTTAMTMFARPVWPMRR